MPTYGRSFTLVDSSKFDIGAPASGGGTPGKYTGEAGFMSYYEVSIAFFAFTSHSNEKIYYSKDRYAWLHMQSLCITLLRCLILCIFLLFFFTKRENQVLVV